MVSVIVALLTFFIKFSFQIFDLRVVLFNLYIHSVYSLLVCLKLITEGILLLINGLHFAFKQHHIRLTLCLHLAVMVLQPSNLAVEGFAAFTLLRKLELETIYLFVGGSKQLFERLVILVCSHNGLLLLLLSNQKVMLYGLQLSSEGLYLDCARICNILYLFLEHEASSAHLLSLEFIFKPFNLHHCFIKLLLLLVEDVNLNCLFLLPERLLTHLFLHPYDFVLSIHNLLMHFPLL